MGAAADSPGAGGVTGAAAATGTVGGVVATGAAGPRRLRYGAPRDLLIGITVVLADGTVASSGGKVVKNVAGYDLGKLFAGSYGTLGLIAEAAFRLHPLPQATAYVTVTCASASDALGAVRAAIDSQLAPSAAEIDRPAPGTPVSVCLLLEGSADAITERVTRMRDILGTGTQAGVTPPVWWGRSVAGSGATALRIAFPPGELQSVLDAVDEAAAGAAPEVLSPAIRGSAGAGVLEAGPDAGDPARGGGIVRDGAAAPPGRASGLGRRTGCERDRGARAGGDTRRCRHMGTGYRSRADAGGQGSVRSRSCHVTWTVRGRDLMEDLRALAGDCVHCGFCLPACPTYQLWGDEMDSPRGRIHLMTQLMDGAKLDRPVLSHLDRCLGCMACVPACPSGRAVRQADRGGAGVAARRAADAGAAGRAGRHLRGVPLSPAAPPARGPAPRGAEGRPRQAHYPQRPRPRGCPRRRRRRCGSPRRQPGGSGCLSACPPVGAAARTAATQAVAALEAVEPLNQMARATRMGGRRGARSSACSPAACRVNSSRR